MDHPRSRGDHSVTPTTLTMISGSPPLTRGPRGGGHLGIHIDGITPAHAGTTSSSVAEDDDVRDHPRSRGDHGPSRPFV